MELQRRLKVNDFELELLRQEKDDLSRANSKLNTDLGLATSSLSIVGASLNKLKQDLDAEKEAQSIADSALATVEETDRLWYRRSDSFKNDALEFVWGEHLGTLADEWLAMTAGKEYLVSIGKQDFYVGYSLMQ